MKRLGKLFLLLGALALPATVYANDGATAGCACPCGDCAHCVHGHCPHCAKARK